MKLSGEKCLAGFRIVQGPSARVWGNMGNWGTIPFLLPFLASAGFVTLNEMGDKTQLLAMAFATRIRFWKVMAGVLIATLLNHGLAVAVGSLLASAPGWTRWVQLFAAVLFLVFGLWALVADKEDDHAAKKKKNRSEVATVAFGFFIAEMGDKTQLATIALAAQYPAWPLVVLAGTTTGMLIADGIGILVGVVLNRKLPAGFMHVFAAVAFIGFGLWQLFESLYESFGVSAGTTAAVVAALGVVCAALGFAIYKRQKQKG